DLVLHGHDLEQRLGGSRRRARESAGGDRAGKKPAHHWEYPLVATKLALCWSPPGGPRFTIQAPNYTSGAGAEPGVPARRFLPSLETRPRGRTRPTRPGQNADPGAARPPAVDALPLDDRVRARRHLDP